MHVSPSGTVHIVSAGPCNIAADQAGNSSYNPAPTVHQSFTIAKATPTLHVTNSPVSYDGSIHAAIVSGSVPGTPSNILTGGAANQTSADTYAVTANFVPTDSTNYNSLTGATAGNFIINQVSSTTVVTCPANQTYTGSAITPCTVSVTGAGSLSLTPAPNYSNNTNVGTATASYTYAGDANHTGSSNSKNFTINNASQTITFNPLSDKTYGDADFTISANANSGLTVTFGSLTNSVCTVSGTDVHIVAQGTCTLRASQTGDTNYNAADNVDQSFNVAKKAASVTPDAISKTYGDVDPTLTGTLIGFLPADSVTATPTPTPTPTVTPTATPTPTPGENECKHEHAECNINGSGKSCCEGLTCVPSGNPSGNGHCQVGTTPTPTPTPSPTIDPCADNQCATPTPTPTPTPTETTTNSGGPGDGLGCATHDCSNHPSSQGSTGGQVLGASTGPQVLGLSTTSGEENYLLQLIQAAGAFVSGSLGFIFFKKNG
jgi:hypothetical protein